MPRADCAWKPGCHPGQGLDMGRSGEAWIGGMVPKLPGLGLRAHKELPLLGPTRVRPGGFQWLATFLSLGERQVLAYPMWDGHSCPFTERTDRNVRPTGPIAVAARPNTSFRAVAGRSDTRREVPALPPSRLPSLAACLPQFVGNGRQPCRSTGKGLCCKPCQGKR